MILLFAQIKDLKSLREIETSLRSRQNAWECLGLETVARSTLADANAEHSSVMFEEMFHKLLRKCNKVAPGHAFRISMPVFTQDATLIPLCLPSFIRMTDGKCHDVKHREKRSI